MEMSETAVAILSKGQYQLLTKFVADNEMQGRAMQIIRARTKLKPSEAIEYGKISVYKSTYGEKDTVGFILLLVMDWNNSFTIENRLSDKDCAECAHMLYRECAFLAMAELAVVLERAKYKAKIYGSGATQRIGKDTFWNIIEAHLEDRKGIVLGKNNTSMSKYKVINGQWVLTEPAPPKGVDCPTEILEAIKSIGTEKKREEKAVEVDERGRDAKNRQIQFYEMRRWFPKEVAKMLEASERALGFGKTWGIDFLMSSRKGRLLLDQVKELKNLHR